MIHSRVQYIYVMTIMLRKDRRIIDSYVTSHLNWFVTGSRVNKHRWFDYFARRVKMSNHAWMYGPSTSARCFEEDSFAEKREEMRFMGAARSLNYAYRVTTASNRWLEATVRVGRNRHVDVRVRRPGSHISYLYHHTLITIQGVLKKNKELENINKYRRFFGSLKDTNWLKLIKDYLFYYNFLYLYNI